MIYLRFIFSLRKNPNNKPVGDISTHGVLCGYFGGDIQRNFILEKQVRHLCPSNLKTPTCLGLRIQPHISSFCRIFTYMWPTIPHPKDTLVQSCNLNTVCPSIFSLKRLFVHVCPH